MDSEIGKMVYLAGSDNYHLWKDRIEDVLYMKRMHAPVFGSKPKDMTDEDWVTEHRVTCGFIRSYCLPQIWNEVNKEKTNAKTL